jgi:nickel/cobalt transporter (NicO) family protein
MRLSAAATTRPNPSVGRARGLVGLALALVVAALALLWLSGAFAAIGVWALEQQRALQGLLAARLQALRAGEPMALAALTGLAAAYGFVHAVGPGHGKLLVTGAALGTRTGARRMGLIALAGSLAQAGLAIAIVYGGFALFALTARGAAGADVALEPLGHLAVALIGAWLLARGLWAAFAPEPACGCGHAHGPSPEAVARAEDWRATAGLVAAMAIRPCTGALIVLVLAWRFDLAAAGALAVLAMGLGTAAFTVAVAIAAVSGREAAFLSAGAGPSARRLGAGLQIGAGALVLVVSGALLCTALVR